MYYSHNISACFSEKIGENGVDKADYSENMSALQQAKSDVLQAMADKVPYLTLPYETEDLKQLEPIVEHYKTYKDIVIFGTGGSSLGAEALQHIASITQKNSGMPKLHIITNIDPYTYMARFKKLDLKQTGFIVISKSGGTVETVMQFLTVLPLLQDVLTETELQRAVTIVTELKDSPLYRAAKRYNLSILEHDARLGGRFSVFSLVGCIPALLVGLSAENFRMGAKSVLEDLKNVPLDDFAPAQGAAIKVALMEKKAMSASVLLAYSDRMGSLARWYRQLWAESVGKNGKGSSPIYGMGPVDQHSQLQLWLDGPADKLFTVLSVKNDVKTEALRDDMVDGLGVDYLQGRSLADLMNASCRATTETLIAKGKPTRTIEITDVSVRSMGAVMMHYMLETVFSAHLLGVDAFDQPAVEDGKVLAREYLQNQG